MIIEIRKKNGYPNKPFLVLLPSKEELKLIEEALGNEVVDDDGLITLVEGKYKVSDGYGPAYLSLRKVTADTSDEKWEEPE